MNCSAREGANRSGFTAVLATVALGVGVSFVPQGPAGAADKVEDYRVGLTRTPPVVVSIEDLGPQNVPLVQQKCPGAFRPGTPFPVVDTPFPCTDVAIQVADAASTVTGTARNSKVKRTGEFTLSCDFVFPATTDVTVTLGQDFLPSQVLLDTIDGRGPLACAWSIVFTGKTPGSLSGTATGSVALSRVQDQQLIATAVDVNVVIVAGTGEYQESAGGGGSYVDTYNAPFEPETATAASTLTDGVANSATDRSGRLHLKLGHQSSRARTVPLVSALAVGDPRALRVVAPKGSRCRASGTMGKRTVSLGKARVSRTGGQATFPGTLRRSLTQPGSWRVTASCKAAGNKLTSPATTVRIS